MFSINILSASVLLLALVFCIFSKKVKDGFAMKIGMGMLVLVCLGDISNAICTNLSYFSADPLSKDLFFHFGGIFILVGRYYQVFINRKHSRRAEDCLIRGVL